MFCDPYRHPSTNLDRLELSAKQSVTNSSMTAFSGSLEDFQQLVVPCDGRVKFPIFRES
jgi:hypothetical protein